MANRLTNVKSDGTPIKVTGKEPIKREKLMDKSYRFFLLEVIFFYILKNTREPKIK